MSILVTGGAGFIGSHLVNALVNAGQHVVVVDSLVHGRQAHVPNPKAEYLYQTISSLTFRRPEWKEVEAVVHLAAIGGVTRAAREPFYVIHNNACETAYLLQLTESMPQIQRVVQASSFSVYGNGQAMPIVSVSAPNPTEPYGASKYMQELCFNGYTRTATTILRFSSVYGRHMRLDDNEATIIAKIAGWIGRGEPAQIFEDGLQTRDFVYVGDVVDAIRASLDGRAPALMNVCSGAPATLLDTCRYIAEATGKPYDMNITGHKRPGDMRDCWGDPTDLTRVLERDPIHLSEGAHLAFGRDFDRNDIGSA